MASQLSERCIGKQIDPVTISVCGTMFEFIEVFATQELAVRLCPEWVTWATIALTIAVSTASPERAFSLVKLVKTRLRSRMSQPMLDAIIRINLLLKFEDLLSFLPHCAETWINQQDRRTNFGDGQIPELLN
jgi:hypothetical protein